MNMDFHVHGLLSKRKDFNKEFFMNEIYFAKSNGLNGILLCEHFNAKDFLVIYDFLEKNFIYEGDRYIVEGISNDIEIPLDSVVTTTGMSEVFPSGILIGKVKEIGADNFDLAKIIYVGTEVNYDDLEYVTILKRDTE